ncbi:MAG: AAA family ATPase, partial [Chloroflexota bacterium]|nr:AAA family ATPase [Chloroflexota bacterium]
MEGSIDEPVSGELPALRLRLLNDFCLVCDEGPVTGLTSARGQSLLAYLALHLQAPQRRQQLAFLFWPDATEAQARNNLRQLMHQLRRAWPATDRYLAADASALSWRHDVHLWIDVAEFESTVALADEAERRADVVTMRAALERAVGLYQGDLLPGCYEDWIVPERQRLGQRYSRTLDRLIALLEGQRAYGAAIEYADERLRHDPLEDAYRQLMRLHALNHDRAGGLRVYQACATWLERELAIEPSPATRQVYERLQRLEALEEMAPASALEVTLPLVERQREWTQVQGAWRRAADGQPHLLLIGGEPGIGKSRLAEELLSWANQQGITTARTRVYAAEGRLSYAPVADWLRSEALRPALAGLDPVWRGEVARLLPELLPEPPHVQSPTPLGEHWQRQHFFQALARAVLSADQPLLLVLDDLQWCDQDTLEWLHYLLRFDRQARLLVAGTARTEEVDGQHPLVTLLTDLRGVGLVAEVALTPLDAAETAQLAAQVIGRALDGDQAQHLYRETEGHPLFVVETARAALATDRGPAAERKLSPASRLSSPAMERLPAKVQAIIAARLAQLSEPTRELASLAATIGRAFTLEVLTHAHDGGEDCLVRGLD